MERRAAGPVLVAITLALAAPGVSGWAETATRIAGYAGSKVLEAALKQALQASSSYFYSGIDTSGVIDRDDCYYVCIGNPGVGKSTLLNSMMRELRFRTGVHIGTGLTFELQIESLGGQRYVDTPGLSDIDLRKQAAAAIKEALQQDGCYKVIFVVTLESGRVRPDDITTMRLVLEAAPEITEYAVIINKVTKNLYKKLRDPGELRFLMDKMFAGLNVSRSSLIHLKAKDPDLEDVDDVLVPLSSSTAAFINSIPKVVIRNENVKDIRYNHFEASKSEYEEMLSKVESQLRAEQLRTQELLQRLQESEARQQEFESRSEQLLRQFQGNQSESIRREIQALREQQEEERAKIEQLRVERYLLRLGFGLGDLVKAIGNLPRIFSIVRGDYPEGMSEDEQGTVVGATDDKVICDWNSMGEQEIPPHFIEPLRLREGHPNDSQEL